MFRMLSENFEKSGSDARSIGELFPKVCSLNSDILAKSEVIKQALTGVAGYGGETRMRKSLLAL